MAKMNRSIDIRSMVQDETVLRYICIYGATCLNKVSATIEEVEDAYNAGHPAVVDGIDYIIFDED